MKGIADLASLSVFAFVISNFPVILVLLVGLCTGNIELVFGFKMHFFANFSAK